MTAIQNRLQSMGRHPLLRIGSLSHRVFLHLKANPELTIREVARTLHEEYQTVNGCLQRMKRQGLVFTTPKQYGDRVVNGFSVNIENETGYARDVVDVEVTVYVNEDGEYFAVAAILGRSAVMSGTPIAIATHVYRMAVPKPKETRMRDLFEENYRPGARKDGPIIDLTPEKNSG